MLRFIKFCSLGLLFLVVLVLVNALTHNPENEELQNKTTFEINEDRAITNLSNSIKFKTISNQNRSEESLEEFERFIDWLKESYQLVHQNTSLQIFNDTLLFKWKGSNPQLKPILVTGHYDVVPVIPGTEDNWTNPHILELLIQSMFGEGGL